MAVTPSSFILANYYLPLSGALCAKVSMCNCNKYPILVEITNSHEMFSKSFTTLSIGNWVKLMQCPNCEQLWRVDEWDKLHTIYAVKVSSKQNWEAFDMVALIKEKMIGNRNGLGNSKCMHSGCNTNQVKGSAYCIHHLYETGTRT